MAKNKKSVSVILLSMILGLIAVAGLVSAFLLNYNTFSPNAPLILDDGENIFITTSLNENYVGYRFRFLSGEEEILVDSAENVVDSLQVVEAGGKLGEEYKVSVCYLAKNSGNNSQFSKEVEWNLQTYLTPTIIHHDTETNMLTWTEVENADFYRVYYNNIEDENFIDCDDLSLDLQQLEVGDKTIYVVACSRNAYVKSSAKSNVLEFKLQHYLSEFSSISFDTDTCILTAENEDILDKLIITLNGYAFTSLKFDIAEKEGKYVYTIDLTAIYNGETIIGISPANVDEYNVFKGDEKVYTVA